jgi:uncharacterized protein (DUF736 family)
MEGRDYLSVKLDDPSWPHPVYHSLIEAEDGKTELRPAAVIPPNGTG